MTRLMFLAGTKMFPSPQSKINKTHSPHSQPPSSTNEKFQTPREMIKVFN